MRQRTQREERQLPRVFDHRMRFGDRNILCRVGAASLADRDLKKQDQDRLVWSIKMAKERKADVLSIVSFQEKE